MINTYQELEERIKNWDKEICIYGAGKLGTTYGYDLLISAGLKLDFYVDSKKEAGIEIKDNKYTRDIDYIRNNPKDVLIFVCMGVEDYVEVEKNLQEYGVNNYEYINWKTICRVLDTVDKADDEVKKRYYRLYDNKFFLERRYKEVTGEELDIDNPRTFNEKLQWLKVHENKPEYSKYVDKYAFKKLIEEKYGSKYIIPLLGVWDRYDDIDFEKLPEKFVLKCTHDSGSVVMCDKSKTLNHDKKRARIEDCLSGNYYWTSREWPYKYVKPRIIAEKYVEDEFKELRDYKLFCFDGEVVLIQVDFDRFSIHKRNIYNLDWEYVPLTIKYPTAPEIEIPRPNCLEEMISIARDLSKGIKHVRVDFYVINEQPIVGEMTFFHGGGMEKFTPNEWNYKLGEYIRLQ